MMKKSTVLLGFTIFLFTILSGCQEECACNRQPDNDYLIFGHFYGLCAGNNCVEIFKIEDGNLYADTADLYPSGNAPYSGTYVPLSSEKYNLVKDLSEYIPSQLLSEGDTIIGIPDAYDQGGYYLEVKENSEVRFWLIDSDKQNIPVYLHSFIDSLSNYIQRLE